MARKKFSCDFETTTDPNDCRVWATAYMEIGNQKNFSVGNNIDDFMVWMEKVKADVYFHNLRFDGDFIVNWLLHNGWKHSDSGMPKTFTTTISNMGQWYMIDICYGYKGKRKLHTVLYDSLKILPFSAEVIAISFQLEILKGEIDYTAYRPRNHKLTQEEYDYIVNDVQIIASALEIQFEQGLEKMTAGSNSLAGFKDSIGKKKFDKLFPVFSIPMNNDMRRYYRGGFTWLNDRYAGKEIGNGIVFDVNSLYPSQMYTRPLPYGNPIYFTGKYKKDEKFTLSLNHIRCGFVIKDGYIPTIQIKKTLAFRDNEYLKSSKGDVVDLYLTNIDLEMFFEHYEIYNLEYIDGWKFREKTGIFNKFIDKWTYVKTHEKGAKKTLAKLMLNSLYGKFATNPDHTGKIPYLKEDGSTGLKMGEEDIGEPIYTPMGIFITSWARFTTISTAQKCYDRIIYCDTDSIHLEGTAIPDSIKDIIDPKKLGYWKHESTFKRGKFLRQKTYVEEMYMKTFPDGSTTEGEPDDFDHLKLNVICAGMPDRIKDNVTFDNFNFGFTSYGKMLPKHVNGGTVLVDTEFTLKQM